MKIYNCEVNHIKEPIGFMLEKPSFSWMIDGNNDEVIDSSRIIIKENNEVIYDSSFCDLKQTGEKIDISLKPRTIYSWRVEVKKNDNEIISSDDNIFETGKMDEEWGGKWITTLDQTETRHPIFFKDFKLNQPVQKARLYITGVGLFETKINGESITDEYLLPYCNAYDKWLQTFTFPIHNLKEDNHIEIMLGNGWYRGRFGFNADNTGPAYGDEWKLLCELHITYEDGSEEVIPSNTSWKVKRSNITFSNIYDGEHVDQILKELEIEDVKETDFDAHLKDRLSLPVIKHEVFHPTILHTPKNETVLDIGQNSAGAFTLKVHEPKGTKIHLQFSEVLQDDCFYRDNLRTAKAEYIFITNGDEQIISPHFTFYGFRYVKVEGITNIKEDDFVAYALYSDFKKHGSLKTGNALINQLISNSEWGMKSNYLDVPTDCPQRDERMGWTGDAQVFSRTGLYFADVYAFFHKYLYDMYQEQLGNHGGVSYTIPSFHINQCATVWGDACTIIPWNIYQSYGDTKILEDTLPSMMDWCKYIEDVDGDNHGWGKQFHFGDWLALDGDKSAEAVRGATDEAFIAYVYYRKSLLIVADSAKVLGKEDIYQEYINKTEKVLQHILKEYYTPSGRCAVMTMTAQILSLIEHIGDENIASDLLKTLLKRNNKKLATGFVGTPLLCDALSDHDMTPLAFTLLLNEERPGWLYEVKLGATTIWERWNSLDEEGHITGIGMNSLNHYSYGSIVGWMFAYCAGLKPILPGYKKASIAPHIHEKLKNVDCRYESPYGTYEVRWNVKDEYHIEMHIVVPYGCEAEVKLPFFKECENELFNNSYVTISQGDYSFVYETNRPITSGITLDSDVPDALENEKIKEYLEKLPLFKQSEFSFSSFTVKEALMSTCNQTEEDLKQIEKDIFSLQK